MHLSLAICHQCYLSYGVAANASQCTAMQEVEDSLEVESKISGNDGALQHPNHIAVLIGRQPVQQLIAL